MRIGVIGDPMVDRYWVGKATMLSPEAPVPKVKTEKVFDTLGGACNVAANLEALGVDVVRFWSEKNIPVKNRLMVGDVQLARWDENDYCVPIGDVFPDPLTNLDAVIVSDYGKGTITPEFVDLSQNIALPMFIDSKRNPAEWSKIPNAIVFPNDLEYQTYQEEYNKFRMCVHKQGAKGMRLLSYGNPWIEKVATAYNVRSVIGAGDTVIAAFAYMFVKLGCLESLSTRALTFANAAAACVVEMPYTTVVSEETVVRKMKNYDS
jgi:D-beta-D-heptose 7-phosphate kinase/D-beta-D-heptose 1-phosphate adenosyltransferase